MSHRPTSPYNVHSVVTEARKKAKSTPVVSARAFGRSESMRPIAIHTGTAGLVRSDAVRRYRMPLLSRKTPRKKDMPWWARYKRAAHDSTRARVLSQTPAVEVCPGLPADRRLPCKRERFLHRGAQGMPEAGMPGKFCVLRPPAQYASRRLALGVRSTPGAGGSNAKNFRRAAADSGSVCSFLRS
jgi:hypothetical protein